MSEGRNKKQVPLLLGVSAPRPNSPEAPSLANLEPPSYLYNRAAVNKSHHFSILLFHLISIVITKIKSKYYRYVGCLGVMVAESGSGAPCCLPRPQVAPCVVLSLNERPVCLPCKPWSTRLGLWSHTRNPSEGITFKKRKIWDRGRTERQYIFMHKSKFEMDLEGKLN